MIRVALWVFFLFLPVLLLITFGASTSGALLFTLQSLCIAPFAFTWIGYGMGRWLRGRRLRVVLEDEFGRGGAESISGIARAK